MTLQELVRETLTEKNRRLRQEECMHEETFSSGVLGPNGHRAARFCFECGKSWHWHTTTTPPLPRRKRYSKRYIDQG